MLDELTGDLIEFACAIPGFNGLTAKCEIPVVFSAASAGDPAIEIKGQGTIGGDPFAVVFSGNVNMCGICNAAFAGWMSDFVACEEIFTRLLTSICGDVHV